MVGDMGQDTQSERGSAPFPVRPVLADVILRREHEGANHFSDLIHIPERHRHPLNQGEVVSIGRDQDRVKVGDVVMFTGDWAGDSFVWEGVEYRAVPDEALIAVVEE